MGILVPLGCCKKKKYYRPCGFKKKLHHTVFWRLGSSRTRHWQVRCLARDHFFIDDHLLSVTKDKGALWDIYHNGINSICEGSTLRPSNLSKASPPHTITLSIRFSTYDFGWATSIQSEQWVSVWGCLVHYWEHCWQEKKKTSIFTSHWWD